jgi:hypothetical protein
VEISNLIVARYLDGRVLKGVTRDFSPNRGIFHVDVQEGAPAVEMRFRQLKALFFVRSLEGDSAREDVRGFVHGPAETQHGKKIAVRFRDGEFLCGYTLSWSPDREGFFLFPADSTANNQRIFVITGATLEIKAGPAAEVLAQRVLSGAPAPGDAVRPQAGGSRPIVTPLPPANPLRSSAPPPAAPTPLPPLSGRRASGFLPRPPRPGAGERRTGSD